MASLPALTSHAQRAIAPAADQAASKLGRPSTAQSAKTEFQALVLTSMVESMLPKDAEHVFGSGTAGSIWRSMMAEKIAAQLAERDVLGLSKDLEKHIANLKAGGGRTQPTDKS